MLSNTQIISIHHALVTAGTVVSLETLQKAVAVALAPNAESVLQSNTVTHPQVGDYGQREIPGIGALWSVPVSKDIVAKGVALVRAWDQAEAIELAQELVVEGKLEMRPEMNTTPRMSAVYCEDDVAVVALQEQQPPQVSFGPTGVQHGPFYVEVLPRSKGDNYVSAMVTAFNPLHALSGAPGDHPRTECVTHLAATVLPRHFFDLARFMAIQLNARLSLPSESDEATEAAFFEKFDAIVQACAKTQEGPELSALLDSIQPPLYWVCRAQAGSTQL